MYLKWITKKTQNQSNKPVSYKCLWAAELPKIYISILKDGVIYKLNWGKMWKRYWKVFKKTSSEWWKPQHTVLLWPQEVLQSYFNLFLTAALGEQHSSTAWFGLEKKIAVKWVIWLWKYGPSEGYCIDSLLIVGGERKRTSLVLLRNCELQTRVCSLYQ